MKRRDVHRLLGALESGRVSRVEVGEAAASAVIDHAEVPSAGRMRWPVVRRLARFREVCVRLRADASAGAFLSLTPEGRWSLRWEREETRTAAERAEDGEALDGLVLGLAAVPHALGPGEVRSVGVEPEHGHLRIVQRTRFAELPRSGFVVLRDRFALVVSGSTRASVRRPSGLSAGRASALIDPYMNWGLAVGALAMVRGSIGDAEGQRPVLASLNYGYWTRALAAPTQLGWTAWTRSPLPIGVAVGSDPIAAHASLQRHADRIRLAPRCDGSAPVREAGTGDVPTWVAHDFAAWRESLIGLRFAEARS